ncbi:MAG: M48 family metalloprotease [Acidobacteria bacterium]|nr:M48 family metalloprotease [Acidobacteriota bacterium]
MTRSKGVLQIVLVFLMVAGAIPGAGWASRRHADVDKIGQRDINGRVAWFFPNFVSLDKEIEIGAQVAGQFEQTAKLIDDPVVNEYVDRLAQNVVRHSDSKVPFHVKVVDTDEPNAFALPGGYFFVNKGLILAAEDESQLVGVMAHEIAHVAARHATERMTKAQLLQFAALPSIFIGGYGGYAIQNALGLGINLGILGVTRESEEEADQLGVQYTWNSGYDPAAFVSFFEKLSAQEKNKPGTFAGFFRTHPTFDDRITKASEEMRYLPAREEYVLTTSEFDRVKQRITELDTAAKSAGNLGAAPAKTKPTLKRRTGADDQEDKSKREKPTLKRPTDQQPQQP